MPTLTKDQRNLLAKVVIQARDSAEVGAKKALHSLGVDEPDAPPHLTTEQRELRRALRAQARQLGDREDPQKPGTYSIWHLMEKIAYDQWHRMLFARFLAENNFLISPNHQVAVTMDECNDLAPELGLRDGWQVATRFASEMLPQIFRADDPTGQIVLAPEDRSVLQQYVIGFPREIFLSDDALGWVYQFWQEKRKDEVNASEVKIGARELPAVTQLFTEPYMVNFLLDNSLGAWWVAHRLTHLDLRNAQSEQELRIKAGLSNMPLEYLRFIKKDDGIWEPAAGTFKSWPEKLNELKILDPCCGSGHFLVAALLMLVPMRMKLENLTAKEAVDAVLRENIYGLEIDNRCVELAAFSLAMAAWRYPNAGGYRSLPELNVACSGLSVSVTKEEWKKMANGDQNILSVLILLHEQFQNAPILGSLVDPMKGSGLHNVKWETLSSTLENGLVKKRTEEEREAGVVAQGLAKAAMLLGGKYQLIATNVPYLARGKQCNVLREYSEIFYPEGKNDLATVFLDRCLMLCAKGGASSLVLPQNWLFLTSYKKLREKLLKNDTWHLIARLGPGAFETISGEVVKAILITISRSNPIAEQYIYGLDVSDSHAVSEKATQLITAEIKQVLQKKQLDNPDAIITLEDVGSSVLLKQYCDPLTGLQTGDDPYFSRYFWEISNSFYPLWLKYHGSPDQNIFGGKSRVVLWENGQGNLVNNPGACIRNKDTWNNHAIIINQMTDLKAALFQNAAFDMNVGSLLPKNGKYLEPIWVYVNSEYFVREIRKIDQSLKISIATLANVPFDLDHWTKIAQEKYPNGLPKPYSNDPTQWIFHGHPCGNVVWDEKKKWTAIGTFRTDATVLQVAIARILGYRWPAELDSKMELSDEAQIWVKQSESLLSYTDKDGIICISAIKGEQPAAERLQKMLAAVFGSEWNSDKQTELLKQVDFEGKNLEDWLRNGFFEQHCQLFLQRPFIWHIWDGCKDGFSALVNYHKLDKPMLEKLTYTYLGDWIARQKAAVVAGGEGSDARLAAAKELQSKLEKILEGEPPFDIFVRWKSIEKQPIGWEPDLNDGVRLNIRPFIIADVLRKNPKINWNKDRGKDVMSTPWFYMFKGNRINDHHLTIAEKRKARERS